MENDINLPSINVNVPGELAVEKEKQLIPNESIVSYYQEAMNNIKEDRSEADYAYKTFLELAVQGDCSSASKEAMVNLLKIKVESSDKMIKILDLMTRIHLRDRDTMPKYLAVQQNNKIQQTAPPIRGVRQMQEMIKNLDVKENE